MERTFVMVKPDAVQRRLVGEIVARFERRGLRLAAMRMLTPSRSLAQEHYAVHRGKPFYEDLVDFVTSGPVVAMVWEGNQAVRLVRQMMGALAPEEALPGTIRGDYTTDRQRNLVHGSDSPETASAEVALWFASEEVQP
ncbi:MAG TPA: nucleoside-diphosphate kinase [Chthonomonadales bacterium]|nr:nucleoside-diphosphate kinase [Chthonomonadales bacterium]